MNIAAKLSYRFIHSSMTRSCCFYVLEVRSKGLMEVLACFPELPFGDASCALPPKPVDQ